MTNRNRRFAGITAAAFAVLIASGCDQGLTEVNENPNAPESVPVENLLLGGIWDVAANGGNRGVFGNWTQLYHAENWVQHAAQPVYNEEDNYQPRGGIPDAIWTEMYFALQDLAAAKRLADGVNDNIWAIAEIMTVYGFMALTDYFGDIPYSEALSLDQDVTAPVYDAQSAIYPDLIARLIAAANRIDTGAIVTFDDFDPVYQGDMEGWLVFANSLQLRLAMRMSNAAAGAAQSAFETAWAQTLISSNAESADVDWVGVQPSANPIYEGVVLAGRSGDFVMSRSLISRLQAFNDPRLPIYAEPAGFDGAYRGLINGLVPAEYTPITTAAHYSPLGSYYLSATRPSALLSYSEVLFLGAEAAELGWTVGVTSDQLYQDAITAAMEEIGVESADITTYLAQNEVGLTTGIYQGLDAIRVQKWISLFFAGPEAFADARRVGFDWQQDPGTSPTFTDGFGATLDTNLTPAANSVLPAGVFPQRLYYPPEEQLYNGANVPSPAPTITTPLWWAP